MKIQYKFFCVILFFVGFLYAQKFDPEPRFNMKYSDNNPEQPSILDKFFVMGGIGIGSTSPTINLDLIFQIDRHILNPGMLFYYRIPIDDENPFLNFFYEYGLVYEYEILKGGTNSLALGFGICSVNRQLGNVSWGIPLRIDYSIRPANPIGFGIRGFVTYSWSYSIAGVSFCLQLGKVK